MTNPLKSLNHGFNVTRTTRISFIPCIDRYGIAWNDRILSRIFRGERNAVLSLWNASMMHEAKHIHSQDGVSICTTRRSMVSRRKHCILTFFLISFNFYTPVSLIFFPSTRVSPFFPFCLRPSFFALCTFVFIFPRSIYFAVFHYFLAIFIIPLSCRILLSCRCRYRSQYPLRMIITLHAFLLLLFLLFLGKSHSRLDVFRYIFNSMDRVSLYNIFATSFFYVYYYSSRFSMFFTSTRVV